MIPDAAPTCPRCHYWELKEQAEAKTAVRPRMGTHPYPLGIDQRKALDLLTRAFPSSYGGKR